MRDELVRVLEVPTSDGQFRFGGPQGQMFLEHDWFRSNPPPDMEDMTDEELKAGVVEFVRAKRYIQPGKRYLVLAETWAETWLEGE